MSHTWRAKKIDYSWKYYLMRCFFNGANYGALWKQPERSTSCVRTATARCCRKRTTSPCLACCTTRQGTRRPSSSFIAISRSSTAMESSSFATHSRPSCRTETLLSAAIWLVWRLPKRFLRVWHSRSLTAARDRVSYYCDGNVIEIAENLP